MENHGYTSPEKNHAINFEEVQKERKQTVPNVGSTTDEPVRQSKADQYAEGFTIHGLSKALLANSIVERIFWGCVLLLAIAMAGFMVKTLAVKFFNQEVYIDTELVKTEKHTFPAVTFCDNHLSKNTFCGYHRDSMVPPSYPDMFCPRFTTVNETKIVSSSIGSYKKLSVLLLSQNNAEQFSAECGGQAECTMSDISEEYFKVTEESPGNCVTWNSNGTFYNLKSKIEFYIEMRGTLTGDIAIYIHDHKESPITMDYFIPSNINQNLDLIFHKVVVEKINRKPPYDCMEEGENDKNIFPGKYTISGCLDTYMCKAIYRECGATLDFCAKYVPKTMVDRFQSINKRYFDLMGCIRNGFRAGKFQVDPSLCPPPCKKTKFQIIPSSYIKAISSRSFKLRLMYQERNSYESHVEKEIYTWEDLISGVGGMVGLFCGFSLLSVLELIIFLGLKVMGGKRSKTNGNVNEIKSKETQIACLTG